MLHTILMNPVDVNLDQLSALLEKYQYSIVFRRRLIYNGRSQILRLNLFGLVFFCINLVF